MHNSSFYLSCKPLQYDVHFITCDSVITGVSKRVDTHTYLNVHHAQVEALHHHPSSRPCCPRPPASSAPPRSSHTPTNQPAAMAPLLGPAACAPTPANPRAAPPPTPSCSRAIASTLQPHAGPAHCCSQTMAPPGAPWPLPAAPPPPPSRSSRQQTDPSAATAQRRTWPQQMTWQAFRSARRLHRQAHQTPPRHLCALQAWPPCTQG